MTKRRKRCSRDIDKAYPVKQFAAKLRRMADCVEKDLPFRIQIAGERVRIPSHATISIEHEREGKAEEVEMQFKWRNS
ncbi:MAG: amphi-Trp domain-containing protein [Phycisphaerae bacterium]